MVISVTAITFDTVLMMLDRKDLTTVRVTVILSGIVGYFGLLAGWITLNIIIIRAWVILNNKPSFYLPDQTIYLLLGLFAIVLIGVFIAVSVIQFNPADTTSITRSFLGMILTVCILIVVAMVPSMIQLTRGGPLFSVFDGLEAALSCLFGTIYIFTTLPMITWFFLPNKQALLGFVMFVLVVTLSSALNPIIYKYRGPIMKLYVSNAQCDAAKRWKGYSVPISPWNFCEC